MPAMFPLRSEADVNNRFKKDEYFGYERARGKLIGKKLKTGVKMDILLVEAPDKRYAEETILALHHKGEN